MHSLVPRPYFNIKVGVGRGRGGGEERNMV